MRKHTNKSPKRWEDTKTKRTKPLFSIKEKRGESFDKKQLIQDCTIPVTFSKCVVVGFNRKLDFCRLVLAIETNCKVNILWESTTSSYSKATKRNNLFLMGTKKKRRRCKADCSLLPSSEEKTVHQPRFDFGTIWIRINRKALLFTPNSLSLLTS